MKNYLNVFIKAILAGILIGIAGVIYLTLYENFKIVGVIMFGFGLLVILAQGYNLYTGKVGYVIDNKLKFLIDILVMIIGNLVGTVVIALIANLAGLQVVIDTANHVIDAKLENTWYQIFGLAVLCGMTMYIAAEGYRRVGNDFARVVIVIFGVAIFLLGRFEHSIADAFYFTLALRWSWQAFAFFILMLLGNAAGAILLNYLEKLAHLKENVCPTSYYEEVKKEPKNKEKTISEPHNFN